VFESGNCQFGETDGTGNTSTTFVVAATNTAGSPGIATRIRLVGYESRGIGVITKDASSNHKFFSGVPYSGANINYTIGYHPSSEDYAGYLSTHASAGGHGSIMVIDGPNKRTGFGAGWGGQGMSHTVDVSGSFRVRTPALDNALLVNTSGNVGIGTATPTNYDSSADNLVVYQGSGHAGITIITDTSSYGILSFGDGTGASSYRGIISYLHSADSMQFQTAGVERIKIDSSGNVGIGTAAPGEGVDVQMDMVGVDWTYGNWSEVWDTASTPGNKFNKAVFHIDTNRNGGATGGIVGLAFSPGWQGHQNWGIYSTNESGGSHSQGDLRFVNQLNTGTITERVTFKADGKVGIGDSTPSYNLDVNGTGRFTTDLTVDNRIAINTTPDAFLTIKTDSDGSNLVQLLDHDNNGLMRIRDSGAAALMNLYDGGVEKITLDADGVSYFNGGNVGIGLTTPSAKLHINGGGWNTGIILQGAANDIGITFMGSDV
jgi:hypothetical protein